MNECKHDIYDEYKDEINRDMTFERNSCHEKYYANYLKDYENETEALFAEIECKRDDDSNSEKGIKIRFILRWMQKCCCCVVSK